ncbi:Octanoyltransferase LipM [Anoxybacillus sp. BCO1]|nr:Octanoyltransferase LipM [Anoxybacillus sp. BCO1]
MEKEVWRFIDSGNCSPAFNMALDEALLEWHSEGHFPPTIRFYGWNPPTLSIGYFQKVEKEIDMDAVKKYGLGFVRRPTGGRGVLHDKELTYSVIVSEAHPAMPQTVTEAYRVISQGILEGFRFLGLDAYFAVPKTEEEKADLKTHAQLFVLTHRLGMSSLSKEEKWQEAPKLDKKGHFTTWLDFIRLR